MAHRTKTPHDYDSRPTFGGFRRPLCLLGACGFVNHLHPPSDASPTLLFFGGGLSSPAKSTISQFLLGNSFGERGARTTNNKLVFGGAEV